jgi:homeobox protein cut-like
VLAGGKLLLGSRFARAFLAVYAVLLHLFIMVLLYYAMSPRTNVVEMVRV